MTRSELRQEERRWRRGDVLAVAAAVVLGAAFAWIVLTLQGITQDSQQKDAAITALAQQVKGLGATPVAGPSGSPGKAGATGSRGQKGDAGDTGPQGPKGDKGDPGKAAPTITPSPGASGAVGATGPQGPQGVPGADSTVPGPQGPQGEKGEKGEKGDTGERGPAGPSCPDGYSPQVPAWDPNALVCMKDGTGQQPGNSDTPSPQALALDPQRRQYV